MSGMKKPQKSSFFSSDELAEIKVFIAFFAVSLGLLVCSFSLSAEEGLASAGALLALGS